MRRRCSHCGSTNVRRSGRLESESHHPFQSPYRCRDCDQRFWVISRKAYFGAVAGVVIVVLTVLVWSAAGMLRRIETPQPQAFAGTTPLTGAAGLGPSADARSLDGQFTVRIDNALTPRQP